MTAINRVLVMLAALLAGAGQAAAHFIFVVPDPGGNAASVVFSETLEADEDVDVSAIGGAALFLRHGDGTEAKLALPGAAEGHAYKLELPGEGFRLVRGSLVFGVQKRGQAPPFLLTYHPKAIVGGDPFNPAATLGKDAVAEIVPAGKPGALTFRVLLAGQPLAGAKVIVIRPDGKEQEVATAGDGQTPPFTGHGRYGVWARCEEARAGTHEGKAYEQVRHYPTLVVDVASAPAGSPARAAGGAHARHAAHGAEATRPGAIIDTVPHLYGKLPEATSSFGATACDGWLYVYGGHIAPTHHYDTQAVSGRFHRIRLDAAPDAARAWESLPGGPALQGMNTVAHGGKVYRVGGMRPLNAPGDDVDNRSVADVARFDPAAGQWSDLPPLPAPRSSHDVVALGDKLFVVGGWTMDGEAGNHWPDSMLVLDLAGSEPAWTSLPQPFQRRALIAAVHRGKLYAIGGFDPHDKPSRRVDIYDPASGAWSSGPELPGKPRNGFAPAACTADGRLYVSVADGTLYRLDDANGGNPAAAWQPVARTTPRIVHRLVPHAGTILVLGGAARGDNFDLIEAVPVKPAPSGPAAAAR